MCYIIQEATKEEKEAEEDGKKAKAALQSAKDDKSLREAQEAEKKAKIRERGRKQNKN